MGAARQHGAGNRRDYFTEDTWNWFEQTFGCPTRVQEETWPAIADGSHVLVSAPTGTGKTLSAFLVFIDRLKAAAAEGGLKEELYLIYVSPLKSLAGDIRENLNRPLLGITNGEITAAVRTGDTPQRERQRMVKHPPHILITTPESLYLMLTSKSGQSILQTARAIIIDELHALIDTKRGAHLMLSIARLDRLHGEALQRIGLSATIEPLELAAQYLAPEETVIVAPAMEKKVLLQVVGTFPPGGKRKDPVWEELAAKVYEQCCQCQSVIAFCEGRRYAEKLAYYVNQLGGEEFARVHHGSLSREQREETEVLLREGRLRLLCATSSMELGIDVGQIDQVLQIGCPRTVSGTMQRLGRAGHNPGRTSIMYLYPRTAPESIACGMTAQLAREGGVEFAHPPRLCLDVLAQHLVSMATGEGYSVSEAEAILKRAYPFKEITGEDIRSVLAMLAGDYEHEREIPVRPRILYDRLHDKVMGDAYSRMLAVAAGGTIPDKGLYEARTEDGVKLGELDEEFVYETRIGDKILLGAFAWRVVRQDRDTVILAPSQVQGARFPFWKGEIKGRSLRTGKAFGRMMRSLSQAQENGQLYQELAGLGLDEGACRDAGAYLERQISITGTLPDDKTIVVEHFTDSTGSHQLMVHSLFGRCVNAPLSLLAQQEAQKVMESNVGCVDEEDGFLLYPYGKERLPEGLLYRIDPGQAQAVLEAVLPVTPVFSMTFRYNAGRSLMMGMKSGGRQPLWLQRIRSTEMLEQLKGNRKHPLIRETIRECLEDQWDLQGVMEILHGIRSGMITVREVHVDMPSPMSLPFQWQVEAAQMYDYAPVTPGLQQAVNDQLKEQQRLTEGRLMPEKGIRPSREALAQVQDLRRDKPVSDSMQLHSLLMMEGDMTAQELMELEEQNGPSVFLNWLEELAGKQLAAYIEPGLWIAAEHREEYELALYEQSPEAISHILRRLLFYRGAQDEEEMARRYCLEPEDVSSRLKELIKQGELVEEQGFYYHARLYSRAQRATLQKRRELAVTRPPQAYGLLMAERVRRGGTGAEQLRDALELLCGISYPVSLWESVLLPGRVKNYRENMLDQLLAEGAFCWRLTEGGLMFLKYEQVDWNVELPDMQNAEMSGYGKAESGCEKADGEALPGLERSEELVYRELIKRGASFARALSGLSLDKPVTEVLLSLAGKGLVCADSFVPVRQWQNREKLAKAPARQRVGARVMALSAGRWDIVRPRRELSMEEWLEQLFTRKLILCRETYEKPETEGVTERAVRKASDGTAGRAAGKASDGTAGGGWGDALELLRIWEYTGRVRRGYFVRGMSGAQFVRSQDYEGIVHALAEAQELAEPRKLSKEETQAEARKLLEEGTQAEARELSEEGTQADMEKRSGAGREILWLNAQEPLLVWGRELAHLKGRQFTRVPGTAVALSGGLPIMVFERQGRVLRLLSQTGEERAALEAFVREFHSKRIYPEVKRLIVKEYPDRLSEDLKSVGFIREMLDYVLYR